MSLQLERLYYVYSADTAIFSRPGRSVASKTIQHDGTDRMEQENSLRLLPFLLLIALLTGPADLEADSAVATLADDTTLYENFPDTNGGGDSAVCIGNAGTTANTRRALLRYTLPAIPAGSTVTRVEWALVQDSVRDMGAGPLPVTLVVRRVTSAWVEGTGSGPSSGPCGQGQAVAGVTWNTQPTVAGADSASTAMTTLNGFIALFDTNTGTANDGLIADVQAWVDDGATNFGWRLAVSEEGTADNSRRMEHGALTIHWKLPPIFADGFESP